MFAYKLTRKSQSKNFSQLLGEDLIVTELQLRFFKGISLNIANII
jgi:hypothetical protein